MIIIMQRGASQEQTKRIIQEIEEASFTCVPMYGVERTVIAIIGDERNIAVNHLEALPGVEKVMRVLKPYKLVSRETKPEDTIIEINKVRIGDKNTVAAIAGPCSVESAEQMDQVAKALSKLDTKILRGGAFKPRTGPYAFQGLGLEGLKILKATGEKYKMATITEVIDVRDTELVAKYTDILQVGARNMQNYPLLRELGQIKKPVMLKRGMTATIEEWLLAAEYILSHGNPQVILCERGIRTFETATRNTLALAAVPLVQELSHLPIIVDPTHATGKRSLIEPMTKALIAAGADGYIIEVHPNPEKALSDAQQQLTPDQYATLHYNIQPIAKALNKTIR